MKILICGCTEERGCADHPFPSPVWSFPELTKEENSIITKARLEGYSGFFPCMNGSLDQAEKTLAGAQGFLEGLKQVAA